MASFDTLSATTESNSDDSVVLRQGSIDYKQTRESLAAGIANARWISTADYDIGSEVIASDGNKYYALVTNGISTTAIDPTTDDGSYWQLVTRVVATATETVEGVVRLATDVEAEAGTEDGAVTVNPKQLQDKIDAITLGSVTGTATLTNSTQNINMTGIGDIEGLEIGDVIQFSNSTFNNTEFTVESITDNDNIIVNYEHRGGTTSKALTDETSTAGVTVKLLCKGYNAPLGLGQGWCTPSTTRSLGVTYNNTTGRTVCISVQFRETTDGESAGGRLYIDGTEIVEALSNGTSSARTAVGAAIPNSESFEVDAILGTVQRWFELR